MLPVFNQRQIVNTQDGRNVQIAVQMREQRPAPRGFPFERRAQGIRIDAQQHQAGLSGTVFGGAGDNLLSAGKMDEPVRLILGGSCIDTLRLSGTPFFTAADVVDRF